MARLELDREVGVRKRPAAAVHPLQLARTARVAGEAFAFMEPEPDRAARTRRLPGGIALMFLGIAAAAWLYLGL